MVLDFEFVATATRVRIPTSVVVVSSLKYEKKHLVRSYAASLSSPTEETV